MTNNTHQRMECPPELRQCLKVVFGLSKAESQLMYYLCNEQARTTQIAEDLDKDASTIRRYLKKLQDHDLIQRIEKSGDQPGRYYEYGVADKEALKRRVKERLDKWRTERINDLEKL